MKRIIVIFLIIISYFNTVYSEEYWKEIYRTDEIIGEIATNSHGDLFFTTNKFMRSINHGEDWEEVISQRTVGVGIDPTDKIIVGPPPLYVSEDNGETWSELDFDIFTGVGDILFDSSGNILLAGTDGTMNGICKPSESELDFDMFTGVEGILFDSSENILYSNSNGNMNGICKSSDNGLNWDLVFPCPGLNTEFITSFVETNDGILFASSIAWLGGGGVYKSLDHGDSWEYSGLNNEYVSSLSLDKNGNILAGSRGHYYESNGNLFISEDNGETWSELVDNILVTSIDVSPEGTIIIGSSSVSIYPAGVQFSNDNGKTWTRPGSDIITESTHIEQVHLSSDGYLYLFAKEGWDYVLYRSIEPTTGIDEIAPNTVELSQNYPNPFNPTTTISFNLPMESDVKLEVYNNKGEMVKKLLNGSMKSGNHSIEFNGSNLSSGVYYYKLTAGKENHVKKMMLIK